MIVFVTDQNYDQHENDYKGKIFVTYSENTLKKKDHHYKYFDYSQISPDPLEFPIDSTIILI